MSRKKLPLLPQVNPLTCRAILRSHCTYLTRDLSRVCHNSHVRVATAWGRLQVTWRQEISTEPNPFSLKVADLCLSLIYYHHLFKWFFSLLIFVLIFRKSLHLRVFICFYIFTCFWFLSCIFMFWMSNCDFDLLCFQLFYEGFFLLNIFICLYVHMYTFLFSSFFLFNLNVSFTCFSFNFSVL